MKKNEDIFDQLRAVEINTAEAESLLGIIVEKLEKIEANTVYLGEIASSLSGLYELIAEKLEPEEPVSSPSSTQELPNITWSGEDDDLLS